MKTRDHIQKNGVNTLFDYNDKDSKNMYHNYKHTCEIANLKTDSPKNHTFDIGAKKSIFKVKQENNFREKIS